VRLFHASPYPQGAKHESEGSKSSQGGSEFGSGFFQRLTSWPSIAFLAVMGGCYIYFRESVKKEAAEKALREQRKLIREAKMGGDWSLTRCYGDFSRGGSDDLKGNFALLYFGFTHCPDICPEEIEKMCKVVDITDENKDLTKKLLPVFITLDPARDSPAIVKKYCEEFSPKMLGYVGSLDETKETTSNFKIYFGHGPVDEDGDYIIDHSIHTFLIGPDGLLMDYYGQSKQAVDMAASVAKRMLKWDEDEKRERRKQAGIFGLWGLLS